MQLFNVTPKYIYRRTAAVFLVFYFWVILGYLHFISEVKSMVEQESRSVPVDRIIIGGFSQGGAVALYTSLTSDAKFGGVLAFSTWLPLHNKLMVRDLAIFISTVPDLLCF